MKKSIGEYIKFAMDYVVSVLKNLFIKKSKKDWIDFNYIDPIDGNYLTDPVTKIINVHGNGKIAIYINRENENTSILELLNILKQKEFSSEYRIVSLGYKSFSKNTHISFFSFMEIIEEIYNYYYQLDQDDGSFDFSEFDELVLNIELEEGDDNNEIPFKDNSDDFLDLDLEFDSDLDIDDDNYLDFDSLFDEEEPVTDKYDEELDLSDFEFSFDDDLELDTNSDIEDDFDLFMDDGDFDLSIFMEEDERDVLNLDLGLKDDSELLFKDLELDVENNYVIDLKKDLIDGDIEIYLTGEQFIIVFNQNGDVVVKTVGGKLLGNKAVLIYKSKNCYDIAVQVEISNNLVHVIFLHNVTVGLTEIDNIEISLNEKFILEINDNDRDDCIGSMKIKDNCLE